MARGQDPARRRGADGRRSLNGGMARRNQRADARF
jgi:hypothetical protein